MTNETSRVIRVAAVQMRSCLGDIPENLNHAASLVEQAANQGAQLILLPELAASGYSLSRAVWPLAETRQGRTIQWLQAIARRLGVHVGIGFVETSGKDIYNSYAIGTPDGQIAGFVRKTMAETICFRCVPGTHVIDTTLGRIGVGICADNHFVPMVRLMQAQSVDLMIMPHAVTGATRAGGLVSQKDVDDNFKKLKGTAPLYTRLLGVPAIFINAVGEITGPAWEGLFGRLIDRERFRLFGLSNIIDLDGTVKQQMDNLSEGFIVADVTLDPSKKMSQAPTAYGAYGGGWIDPGLSGNLARDLICYVESFFGRVGYTFSIERRKIALEKTANYFEKTKSKKGKFR